jgi:hypothetical protein
MLSTELIEAAHQTYDPTPAPNAPRASERSTIRAAASLANALLGALFAESQAATRRPAVNAASVVSHATEAR